MSEMAQALAKTLADLLLQQKRILATAESCTGGGLAYVLTSLSGSSQWFDGGLVTYSNIAKQNLLGVNKKTLEEYGAVSTETAKAMAEGALQNTAANITIAITGIAGPGGGSIEKPVGTVWFGLGQENKPTLTFREIFIGNRAQIREQAIIFALQYLILNLKKTPL